MIPKDLGKRFPDDRMTLEHLTEEAGEVIQAKSKIIRFGLGDCWPVGGVSNRSKLEKELGQLLAVIDVLVARGIVSKERMDAEKENKWDRMEEWNAYRGTRTEIS